MTLVQHFPLRPIRNDAELDRAIAIVNSLIDRDERTEDEEDYLDVLGDLVRNYERAHHPIAPASDASLLRHLIEAQETTQTIVAKKTGIAKSTLSEIIAGQRMLNRTHITRLALFFKVSPAVFFSRPVAPVRPPKQKKKKMRTKAAKKKTELA
jgi:HTH-type transcriptional regulator/antitoxin HigA